MSVVIMRDKVDAGFRIAPTLHGRGINSFGLPHVEKRLPEHVLANVGDKSDLRTLSRGSDRRI